MPCLLCGDICRCTSDAQPAAVTRWLPDADVRLAAPPAELETPGAEEATHYSAEGSAPDNGEGNECAPADSPAWRQEVAARLNRYQARRKPRPPRYPSLRLRFEEDSTSEASGLSVETPAFPHRMATASNRALALDGFAEGATHIVEDSTSAPLCEPLAPAEPAGLSRAYESSQPIGPIAAPTAKIIEFPRSWTPAPAPV